MEKLFFLSHILDEKTPTRGGKGDISLKKTRQIGKGDVCNEMRWAFGDHTGTHVDAPRHFLDKGRTVERFSAAAWLFHQVAFVAVHGVKPGQIIVPGDLGVLGKKTELLLIKTGHERLRGREAYWKKGPGLHPDLAGWLRKECPGLRAVGMDILSISSLGDRELGRAAHREFLKREILLIEDMALSSLKKAPQRVLVAPLRVKNCDAAPCSVFAWGS